MAEKNTKIWNIRGWTQNDLNRQRNLGRSVSVPRVLATTKYVCVLAIINVSIVVKQAAAKMASKNPLGNASKVPVRYPNIQNGILLRSDIHRLFDKGYLTVTPQLHVEVSRRIKEEFDNGKYYFTFHGKNIYPPTEQINRPSSEFLTWHNDNIFRE